jgi:hypothetical protein
MKKFIQWFNPIDQVILLIMIGGFIFMGLYSIFPDVFSMKWAYAEEQPFDHSNCQYPDRWSNPTTGCDNSDPAVPECIKASSTQEGEATCIAAFVKAHEQPAVEPVTTTPATTTPTPTINQCEGK